MSDKKYNYCILLFLIAVIGMIIATDNIGNFINARMIVYTYISLGLLIVFFIINYFKYRFINYLSRTHFILM